MMTTLKTLLVVLSLKALFANAQVHMLCEMQAYPTPAYHALGEQDLRALDMIIAQTFTHHAVGDVFDHSAPKEIEEMTGIQTIDQIIAPMDEDRRRTLLDDPATTDAHRELPWAGWVWHGSASMTCDYCGRDNRDGGRHLAEANNLEGVADALVVSLLESDIEYFSEITCVTYTCDNAEAHIDEISVGCLA
jgi:hypothetical protein